MTVYVVTWGSNGESKVYKIFDSEEKAKEFCAFQTVVKFSYRKFEVE